MSFNQISGKIHDRKPLLRRGERENSNRTTIPYRRDANMISQKNSFRDCSLEDESMGEQETKLRLPSIRRESLGKIQKISLQQKFDYRKRKFFTQVNLQENSVQEKTLSPVLESKISFKIPKKLSLNRWQQRVKQQQQSIIFNYLNEKISSQAIHKRKKKKKKLAKSAQKLEKMDKLYVLPKIDPRINRRQFTEFKLEKSSKINILQPHQKRRSLNIGKSKQLFALRRQTQKFKKQTEILEELKQKVTELERSQKSLENTPQNRKVEFTNRTIESMSLALNANDYCEIERIQSKNSNRTNRTIQKTTKTIRESIQRKQSFRKITQVPIQFQKKPPKQSQTQRDLNLAQTIKFDDLFRQEKQASSYQLSKKSYSSSFIDQQSNDETVIHKESFQEVDEMQQKSQKPNENSNEKNKEMNSAQICDLNENVSEYQKLREKASIGNLTQKPRLQQPSRISDKSFLQIRTYYADISENPKLIQKTMSLLQYQSKTFNLPKLPSKEELTIFIQNYISQNPNIKLSSLITMENFEVILQENQELYFGQIVQNKKSGFGVTIRHNYLYEGSYKDGQSSEGLEVNEMGKYFGEFKNNKKHGQGQFLWKNGETYDGQWANGKKHGQGTWSSPNGDTYEGSWVNGKVEGRGIHISFTGQKYEGSFREYLKSGWGKETLPNGDIYEGHFSNGKPHGQGIYKWRNGESYKGHFCEGFRHGNGTLKDFQGNKYRGNFNKEQACGKCEITFMNQDSFSGEIKNGKFQGYGTLVLYEEEEIWKGFWEQDYFIEEKEESHS